MSLRISKIFEVAPFLTRVLDLVLGLRLSLSSTKSETLVRKSATSQNFRYSKRQASKTYLCKFLAKSKAHFLDFLDFFLKNLKISKISIFVFRIVNKLIRTPNMQKFSKSAEN